MGLFDKFFSKTAVEPSFPVDAEHGKLYLPIEGEVIPLEEIGDGVFSAEVLGKGCGIIPAEEKVYSPVNGKILNVAETKHAIGILSEDGIEVLIHVGVDTVDMNGSAFQVAVKEEQQVKCGDFLMSFSMEKIKAVGHPTTTAFVVTNSDEFSEIELIGSGMTQKLKPVLEVK